MRLDDTILLQGLADIDIDPIVIVNLIIVRHTFNTHNKITPLFICIGGKDILDPIVLQSKALLLLQILP